MEVEDEGRDEDEECDADEEGDSDCLVGHEPLDGCCDFGSAPFDAHRPSFDLAGVLDQDEKSFGPMEREFSLKALFERAVDLENEDKDDDGSADAADEEGDEDDDSLFTFVHPRGVKTALEERFVGHGSSSSLTNDAQPPKREEREARTERPHVARPIRDDRPMRPDRPPIVGHTQVERPIQSRPQA